MTNKNLSSAMGIYLHGSDLTLEDIYKWLEAVEHFNVPRNHRVTDVSLSIYIDIPIDNISSVECGDHLAKDGRQYDVLINVHDCTFNN